MSIVSISFKITSGNLETSCSCDCQKWIRHLAANRLKTDDLFRLSSGKFPAGRMFVLDMIEYLRKSDAQLNRFLSGRNGIHRDDHLSIEFDGVRQLLKKEFPELVAQLAQAENAANLVKRRPGTVDLSPLAALVKKR